MLLLLAIAIPARATDYTDVWWNPTESGWGINLAQNGNFIFATFFIYGPDKAPTWYTAQLIQDATGQFTGPLYSTTGPWFGGASFDANQVSITHVGTATFQPKAADVGVLTYSVAAVQVAKHIQRQALAPIPLAGSYVGALGGVLSDCSDSSKNGSGNSPVTIDLSQTAGQVQVTIGVTGFACSLAGPAMQAGQLVAFPAAYSCSNGFTATATVYELRSTSLGIEGRWSASNDGGCHEEARFAGISRIDGASRSLAARQ